MSAAPFHADTSHRTWRLGARRELPLDQPRLMGILNVTPDSFSDGGRFRDHREAIATALSMVEQGASIIDVGAESTRPGATRIGAQEQIDRALPIIEGIGRSSSVHISIDTTLAAVARAALDAGATIINDVAAGLEDDRQLPLAAERGCGLILMHRRVRPDQDRYSHEYARDPAYGDLLSDVAQFLRDRADAALRAGVDAASIVIDPGLGFGKSVTQNFELIRRIAELEETGYPVLSAASRKSFLGAVSGIAEPRNRVAASITVTILHWQCGVRLFRVHDVAAHAQALKIARAAADPNGQP